MRGLAPDDLRLFGDAAVDRLRAACVETIWLLDRGYPLEPALAFVGDHHQLEGRQRLAVRRAVARTTQLHERAQKEVPLDRLEGSALVVDGFNLLVTLETALSGGLVFEGLDGCYRDLAGLRGSYRVVPETERALDRVEALLRDASVSSVEWLLDAPVSNSARLRARIEARAWSSKTTARLVPDPDAELVDRSFVVSADSVVLDRARSWVNLARAIVERLPEARVVRLTCPLRPA